MPSSKVNPATQLLSSALTDLVTEVVESKCQKLSNRERKTLERRIDRAVAVFVEGMQLSPQQKRTQAKRDRLKTRK
jgi:hypothetical protein